MPAHKKVFVRALGTDGRYGAANACDLTEESFRRFVLDKLIDAGVVYFVEDKDNAEGNPYQARVPLEDD